MSWKQAAPLNMKAARIRQSPAMAAIAINRRTNGPTGKIDLPNGSIQISTATKRARPEAGISNAASSIAARILLRVLLIRSYGHCLSLLELLDAPQRFLFLSTHEVP